MPGTSGAGRETGTPGTVDIAHLEEVARDLLDASIAPSTARVYATGQRRYLSFCRDANMVPLPTSERLLCLFVAHLAERGLQHSSIKGYLSAVSDSVGDGRPVHSLVATTGHYWSVH